MMITENLKKSIRVKASRPLVSLAFIILAIEFVDWPVPKTLDIFVCQTSENKAFKIQHCVTFVREEQEHNLISSPVSTFSARSAEQYDPAP